MVNFSCYVEMLNSAKILQRLEPV